MNRRFGVVSLIGLLFAVLFLTGCQRPGEDIASASSEPSASATASASFSSSPSASPVVEAKDINVKAAEWVRLVTLNFQGVNKIPKECQNWTPTVDLTEAHYYYKATNKESTTAFGPDMGKEPCEIAINLVERMYRDSMLLVDVAHRRGLIDFRASEMADQVSKYNDASSEERQKLADTVLGWYANSNRVLTVVHHKGGYRSNVVSASSGTPVTQSVRSTKASNVLVGSDRKTGKVEGSDRLNCGLQDFVPDHPIQPPTSPPTSPPTLQPKDPSQDPGPQGNAPQGGGHNDTDGPGSPNPSPTFPSSPHTNPPAPSPSPTHQSTPPPPPATGAPDPSHAPSTCVPAPGDTC